MKYMQSFKNGIAVSGLHLKSCTCYSCVTLSVFLRVAKLYLNFPQAFGSTPLPYGSWDECTNNWEYEASLYFNNLVLYFPFG